MAERASKRFYIWDLKELNGFTHTSLVVEPFNMWPSGNCGHVYPATSQQAKRHISGWAMRNTNNHNINILKKSCLGVLVCNRGCRRPDSTPVAVRPAICDKARRKQIGRKCPNGCGGVLILQQCKGHNGYPVTHFWRHYEDKVFFIGKGFHDHPKPEVKLTSEKRRAYTKNPNRISKRLRQSYTATVPTVMTSLPTNTDSVVPYQPQGSNSNVMDYYSSAIGNQNITSHTQQSQFASQHFQQQQQQLMLERHIQSQLHAQQIQLQQQLHGSYSSYPSCQYQQHEIRRKYYETASASTPERASGHLDSSFSIWNTSMENGGHLSSYVDNSNDSRYRFLRHNAIGTSNGIFSPTTTSSSIQTSSMMKPIYQSFQTPQSTSSTLDGAGTILDLSLVPTTANTWRSESLGDYTSGITSTSAFYGGIAKRSTQSSNISTSSSTTIGESSALYVPKVSSNVNNSLELPKFMTFPALMDGMDPPEEIDIDTTFPSPKTLSKTSAKSVDITATATSHATIHEMIDIDNLDMGDISNIVNLSGASNRPPPALTSDLPTTTGATSSLPALSSFLRGIEYL